MRRLVNFVRRSCAIPFQPATSRYNYALEQLRQRFRRILRRDLTAREERLLELSEPLLGPNSNQRDLQQDNDQAA